ncbi:MAG TPA: DUF2905 family protein [Sphingobacteriaceae bacterium]|nr:DUF2905 family protein [Sphingobacteriaceae bacterium]
MSGLGQIGRLFMYIGGALFLLGLVLILAGRLGLGRLPGDIVWRRGPVTVFFPLATSLLLSLLLTLLLNLLARR